MVLVDTNVLLDVVDDDPKWADWSQAALERAALTDRLMINDVVYAELSVGYTSIDEVDRLLEVTNLTIAPIPRAALFLAGKAFKAYRASGGARTGVLPDFFIGAHAAVSKATLLTRDARRYRTYFPEIALIAPP